MMNMSYQDPLILILNITVIIILILLILPVLLNKKERIAVRISFSMIFLVVVVNCISNLIIFYFGNYEFLGLHFSLMFVPFLFGPAILYYVKGINGLQLKNILPHLIIPIIVIGIGIYYFFLNDTEKEKIINEMREGNYLPYNFLNTLVMAVPMYYFVVTKIWIKKLKLDPQNMLYSQQLVKKKWSNEFVNYIMFSVFSFLIIVIFLTYIYHIPQPYLDLIGMPIYFPFLYSIIAVRNNMISKELELQYIIAKTENETKLTEQRLNISRDLHDNIGAYANSLIAKIDHISASENTSNPEKLKDVKENAEQILSLLRQTIWVLNHDETKLDASFEVVTQYALRIFKNTGIKVNFEENISNNKTISSNEASVIFRIIQEALQNVMKHSSATEVKIEMNSIEKFEIKIQDNGKGFSENEIAEGYGLQNMKQRAKQLGMKLTVQNIPENGTLIIISD